MNSVVIPPLSVLLLIAMLQGMKHVRYISLVAIRVDRNVARLASKL